MDPKLKQIIDETVNEFFEDEPAQMLEKGIRQQAYDICPHCKKEIFEKHEYTDDGGKTWRHSDCKGLITRFNETITESLAKTKDETAIIPARDGVLSKTHQFHDKDVTVINISSLQMKLIVTEIAVPVEGNFTIKKFIIKVEDV